MQWFDGGIAEAVTASKSRNAVFVVFVEGKDDASKSMAEAINNTDITAKLQSSDYVAIRIESDTTAHRQLAQIYQRVPVPSLFFIGNSGQTIDVVAGATDAASLRTRIDAVEAAHAGRPAAPAAPASASQSAAPVLSQSSSDTRNTSSASTADPSTSALSESAEKVANETTALTSAGAATTSVTPGPELASDNDSQASVEDRVERAKELLEKKRLHKQREEQEEERRKEIERRKVGQDVQQLKRWQQDQELKQLNEQRKREREENELARQRVLDQIAQDRANRSAQQQALNAQRTHSAPEPQPTQRSSSRANDGTARIQFRLPDGSTHTNSFEATSTLAEVRSHLTANVTLPFRSFILATTFPRREFREEDDPSTMQDLGLVPSAVILVIPSRGTGVVSSARPGLQGLSETINNAIWTLLSPVFTIFTFLRTRIFGGPDAGNQGPASDSNDASANLSQAKKSQDKRSRRTSASGGAYKRSGTSNIHRLHQNHSSSDDDNNTWNGNSTQQM